MTASAIAVKPWKAAYEAKLWKLLKEYGQILVISTDNAESNQLQKIRRDLHADSVMVLGKNTLKRRTIKMDADSSGNKAFLNLLPLLVGNVALIFTKADLKEVSEVVAKYEEQRQAEAWKLKYKTKETEIKGKRREKRSSKLQTQTPWWSSSTILVDPAGTLCTSNVSNDLLCPVLAKKIGTLNDVSASVV